MPERNFVLTISEFPIHRHSTAFVSCVNTRSEATYFKKKTAREVDRFVSPIRAKKSTVLEKNRNTANEESKNRKEKEEKISDLDARVLRSILEEGNSDITTEENLKQLLERPVYTPKQKTASEVESEYSSTVLKKAEKLDTKFWNAVGAKFGDVVESAAIFIINGIERNTKVLATLGLYVFERAARDVGRALPSAGGSGANMLKDTLYILSSNSSYVKYDPADNFVLPPSKYSSGAEKNIFDELNTPLDEIKSVTSTIGDIIAGKSRASSDRGLKSVSKAGFSNNAARQQRAYERRKATTLKREKEGVNAKIGRAANTVVGTAWELKRELEAEGNKAGYRSETVRKTIQGRAAKIMTGSKRKSLDGTEKVPLVLEETNEILQVDKSSEYDSEVIELTFDEFSKEDSEVISSDLKIENLSKALTIEGLIKEQARLVASLRLCLEDPSDTWILTDFNEENVEDYTRDEEALKQAIDMMVFVRDDMESNDELNDSGYNQSQIIAQLQKMEQTVNAITSLAAAGAGPDAAQLLKVRLLGQEDVGSLLAFLTELIEYIERSMESMNGRGQTSNVEVQDFTETFSDGTLFPENARKETQQWVTEVDVVDGAPTTVMPDVISSEPASTNDRMKGSNSLNLIETDVEFEVRRSEAFKTTVSTTSEDEDSSTYANAELVLDDDDSLMENAKSFDVAAVEEDADLEEKENLALKLSLRTLDVALFVGEKALTTGVPAVVTGCTNIVSRTTEIQREGKGKEGWDSLRNVNRGSKRY